MSTARALREGLARPGLILSVGAHDVLSAMLAERAGLELVFVGGFSTSATRLGLPDLDFLGMHEMAEVIRRTTARVSIPVVGDGNTGYGDGEQVRYTVREYERAGAAGIILEDQVFPKRCGHFEGQRVIPAESMVEKLRTARRAASEDFVLFARTDALAALGLEEAIARALKYTEAGADVIFIEAPRSREDIEAIAARIPGPKLLNQLAFGKTPLLAAADIEALGFHIAVAPIATLLASVRAVEELLRSYREAGDLRPFLDRLTSFEEIRKLLGEGPGAAD